MTPQPTQPEPKQNKSASATAVTLMIGVAIGGLGIPAVTGAFSVGSAQASTAMLSTVCINSNASEDIQLSDGGRSFVVRADITGVVTTKLPDAGQETHTTRKNVSWAGSACDADLLTKAVDALR